MSPKRATGWLLTFALIALVLLTLLVSGCVRSSGSSGSADNEPVGGRVCVQASADAAVPVYFSWSGGNTPAGKASLISPGDCSPRDRDADGWCSPSGYGTKGTITGWPFPTQTKVSIERDSCRKITSGEVATVTTVR